MLAKHQRKHDVINVARLNIYTFLKELTFCFPQEKCCIVYKPSNRKMKLEDTVSTEKL